MSTWFINLECGGNGAPFDWWRSLDRRRSRSSRPRLSSIEGGFVAAALQILVCSLSISAQAPAGSLRGQVVDQFGGLIVGATVTATDANGAAKTVVTNNDGSFVISNLAVGKCTVRIDARGFAVYEKEDVAI